MNPPDSPEEVQRRKDIERSFAQHRIAVENARLYPEGRTAHVVDAEEFNLETTTTPKKRSPRASKKKYKHLTPEIKNAIVSSVMSGSNYRSVAKIFDVSISEVSYLVHKTHKELNTKTQSGGRREGRAKVTPDIVKSLTDIVSAHPQYTLREMHSDLIEKENITLSTSSISSLLRNLQITCKRLYKGSPMRSSDSSVSMRIEWACTFHELRDLGCNFFFVDESGFNVSLGRGRGYARVGESPSVIVPPKGPKFTLIAMMGKKFGLVHKKYIGGVNAKIFDRFLRDNAQKIKEAYKNESVVFILDNARVHKGSKVDGIDIPRTMHDLGFFHLFTIPYSPQLNAIEMVFSQLKSYVVSEFMQHPERRKDLGKVIDESMARVTKENIEKYYQHQATVVTQCLRGIPLTPDTLKYNEVDDSEEEDLDEVFEQDTNKLLDDVRESLKK